MIAAATEARASAECAAMAQALRVHGERAREVQAGRLHALALDPMPGVDRLVVLRAAIDAMEAAL